jgi:hypothetical protein
MGSTFLIVTSKCSFEADCGAKTFSADCSSNWKLRDWFTDPLSTDESWGIPFEPRNAVPDEWELDGQVDRRW